ncbi:MAG TPA: hypothetical protein PLS26_05705 [Bacteroidales bacterium]|nr:hypothetical protein [Bacteroidales bacterium]
MLRSNKPYFIFFVVLSVLTGILVYYFRWSGSEGQEWKSIIDGDGKGYYAYYDQIVFRKNFGTARPDNDHIIKIGDRSLIKYQCGTALLMAPFFLSSALVSGFPDDPYAEAYQKSVSVAAIFYLLLGFVFLVLLLKKLKIKPPHILISLALTLFSTNLLVYVVAQPDMSHVYSFSLISGFLWASHAYIIKPCRRWLIISAVFLGIIYLIRPVNIMILLFVLFFFDDFKSVRNFIQQHKKQLLVFAVIVSLVMAIQNVLWYIQCRHFFLWSYQNEGFYWLHPEIFNVLFSFRKGLFIYTPILIIVFWSLAVLLKTNKFRFFSTLFFLIFISYIISSWWCWTYFDSFGMRPFIDFYGIFVLLLALLLSNIGQRVRTILLLSCIPLLALNLLQSYQYNKRIISAEYMNFESYKYIFFKTSLQYVDCIGGAHDLIPYNKFTQQLLFSTSDSQPADEQDFGPGKEFSHAIYINNQNELFHAKKMYAQITFKKWDYRPEGTPQALFVAAVSYQGHPNAFYKVFRLDYLPRATVNKWNEFSYTLILPKIEQPTFELKMYIWNRASETFKLKDLTIKIFKTG